jgi:LAGLIDADG endonuclease.
MDLNNVIVPHFIKYPLITEKQKDFEFFRLALDLINKKEHLNIDGMKKIISIRGSMNRKSLNIFNEYFSDIVPLELSFKINNDIKDPNWITGFVDGEGCFYIKPRKVKSSLQERFYLSFRLSQHSRDILLMNNISNFLNCGLIELSTSKKIVRFVVDKFSDNMNKIIPFFEKYPLLSTKRLDFQDFCKVSCILKEKSFLNEEDILKIKVIKSNMNSGR